MLLVLGLFVAVNGTGFVAETPLVKPRVLASKFHVFTSVIRFHVMCALRFSTENVPRVLLPYQSIHAQDARLL